MEERLLLELDPHGSELGVELHPLQARVAEILDLLAILVEANGADATAEARGRLVEDDRVPALGENVRAEQARDSASHDGNRIGLAASLPGKGPLICSQGMSHDG